jgi:hypothetical protein
VQRTAFRARPENINISKGKKRVQIVKLDDRPTLLETIKLNVCCVLSVKRLHELAVQNVKTVVPVDMVMVAKSANLVDIVPLPWTTQRPVLHAVLECLNQTLDKQAVSPVSLAHIKTNLVNQYAKNVTQDCFVDPKMLSVLNVQVAGCQKNPRPCHALNVFLELIRTKQASQRARIAN